jgi:chaperonin GroEL
MAKDITFNLDSIVKGMALFSKTVGTTLGPKGRNVIYDRGEAPTVTKDGVTVAKEIELSDPLQNLGCSLLRVGAAKTSDTAGDGTTTATVLGYEMVREGYKLVCAGHNPVALKSGMDKAVAQIKTWLKGKRKIVKEPREVAQIATLSSNGDTQIGTLIADAMDMIGQDGVISVEESQSVETYMKIIEGLKIDAGYISPEFLRDGETRVELQNALILCTDIKIHSLHDVEDVLNQAIMAKRPILFVCDSFVDDALKTFTFNHKKKILEGCALRVPGVGDKKREVIRDIAIATGSQFITRDLGLSLKEVTLEHLGHADKVILSSRDTLIIGGNGDAAAIQERVNYIKTQIKLAWSEFDIERYQDRLGRLLGGVATIFVGATTEIELKEKKARVEDALNATQSAVTSGILPGGGTALLRAKACIDYTAMTEGERYGAGIIAKVLEVPIREITAHAGVSSYEVIAKVLDNGDFNYGYNAATDTYEDLLVSGVIDPINVVLMALESASSIAGITLNTSAAITSRS